MYNVKLSVSGHPRKLDSILITLTVNRDGNTETLAPTGMAGSAPLYQATASVTASIGRTNYVWGSDAGTVKTNRTGKVGSLQATLPPSTAGDKGAAHKKVTLKMSWSRCSALGQPA